MKAILLTVLLSINYFSTMADEPKTQLVVWAKDGTMVIYALEQKPKVTFTETDLVIKANNIEVNYSLNNMSRITYEYDNITNVLSLQTDEQLFKLEGEALIFPSLRAKSTVNIYALDGRQVFKKSIRKNGGYAFPLSMLGAGMYIVSINGVTYKIMKK